MTKSSLKHFIAQSLLGAVVLCGCNTQSVPQSTPKLLASSTADAVAEPDRVVRRSEFDNWNKFPVGTMVTRSRDISNSGDKANQVTVYRLVSKNDNQLVVESTVTITRDGKSQTNDPTLLEYASTFRLPPGMTEEQFSLPSPKAQPSGTETIEVLGHPYEATIYKWQSSAEAGPVENTLWLCNDIPGRSIKHQSNCVGTITEEVITQLEVPAVN